MEQIYERDPRAKSSSKSHSARRKQKRSSQANFLLFYILPFILINGVIFFLVATRPHITIQVADTKDYKTTTASITVSSFLPITEFTSSQEGSPLELTAEKKNRYTADITQNGVIEIYAKSVNGMTAVQYEHVNILDDVGPLVHERYAIEDGLLTITLEDSQSGLDYQSVCAFTPSGEVRYPVSSDKQAGAFTFEIGEEGLIIHASDLAGNPMQATFSTHMEASNSGGAAPEPSGEAPPAGIRETAAEDSPPALAAEGSAPEMTEPEPAGSSFAPEPVQPSSGSEVSIYIDTTAP